MSPSLPTVSVLMGLYNYEHYVERALQSALDQDYPAELMEIVVVDDGSTDGGAAVVEALAARHPGRIRLVRQANGGYIAATNRALAEARGELLALLDADDMWLPEKTRRQVELLQARPELGLVFSDMLIVDGDDLVTGLSLIGELGDLPRQAFARLLYQNVATQSSIMVRRSLRELFAPIPAGITYADWWLTLRAAQRGEIDYVREPLALYRQHGANLTGGATGPAAVREHRKEVKFQLWCLRHLSLEMLSPQELQFVWSGVEEHARRAVQAAGSLFVQLADAEPADGAEADRAWALAEDLRLQGDFEAEALTCLRALAWDPWRVGGRSRMEEAVSRAVAAAASPHPLRGARAFVTMVAAEALLADDELLLSWADAMDGSELITLAIDATRLPVDAAAEQLTELVDRCRLNGRTDIDLVAVTGALDEGQLRRMHRGVHAWFGARLREDHPAPVFTVESLPQLRRYAQTALLLGSAEADRLLAEEPLLSPLLA